LSCARIYGGQFEIERNVIIEMMTIVVDLMWNSMASIGFICGQINAELI
jgi:hypothetical protein